MKSIFMSMLLMVAIVCSVSAQTLELTYPTYTPSRIPVSMEQPISISTPLGAPRSMPKIITPTAITVSEPKTYVTDLGLTFPIKPSAIKDYINANGITTLPLTSGYSSGFQIGKHQIISDQATIGIVAGANFFVGSTPIATNQIYQLGIYATGRLYFGESWRGGLFAELGAGPEGSAASFNGTPFVFQGNIGARVGAGYNYKFNKDVTIGLSLQATPSISAGAFTDGARVLINMLW